MYLFPDENGVVVRTDRTIESRIKGLPPPAILFDKNTYLLQVNSRESVVAAILCEHGEVLTIIKFSTFFVVVISTSQTNVYEIFYF